MPALLGLVLALLWADVQVDARCEVSGGRAPVVPGQAAEAQVGSRLDPELALLLRKRTRLTRLRYVPRVAFRHPNAADRLRPLVLHTIALRHEQHASRRTDWEADVESNVGDIDYVALGQLLPGQAALPEVTRVFAVTGGASLTVRPSRRWRLDARLSAGHQRPLETPPVPMGGVAFPRYDTAALAPISSFLLSRRDALLLRGELALHRFSTGLTFLSWQPQAAWRRNLSRAHELTAGAGVSLAATLERPAQGRSLAPLSPIGDVRLTSILYDKGGVLARSEVGLLVGWTVDPVLAVGLPRGQVGARLPVTIGRDFTIAPEASFATSLTRDPLAGAPDETFYTASLPLRLRASDHLTVEMGGRFTERRPHLDAPASALDARPRQRELWAWVTVIVSAATFDPPR